MQDLHKISASEIARRTAAGEITAEAVVNDCLERIESREATVHAWASLDPELTRRQARELDRGPRRGPLHGVPLGVKDVLDTADLPTEMGSPIYRGHRPASDAACVALVRAAGAIILGKTVTAEFAGMTPGPTANPHNPAHTPGGSSSGSGAAVADFMVPAAFGTQTGGSILRPASYCGVIGYKPSYGAFSRSGLKLAAESLDTIGLITRSIDDIELLTAVLLGKQPAAPRPLSSAPVIGLCRTPLWDTAQPETVEAIEDAARNLSSSGAKLREVVLPPAFAGLKAAAREAINNYERSKAMAFEWNNCRDLVSERLQRCIQQGLDMPHQNYLAAVRLGATCRAALNSLFDDVDVLLAPCVKGEAPVGLTHTGDPDFQAIWTLLHVPTMSLPTHRGPNGLPVGIQIVAPLYQDERLFVSARWIWQRLGPA
ncbi:MAG TPA: amidase [Xanthobacteraceae bacterium]|nr:amidase [Xanthobacteraceae bacterium]